MTHAPMMASRSMVHGLGGVMMTDRRRWCCLHWSRMSGVVSVLAMVVVRGCNLSIVFVLHLDHSLPTLGVWQVLPAALRSSPIYPLGVFVSIRAGGFDHMKGRGDQPAGQE